MPSQCLSLGSFWFNMSNEARIMHGLKNPIAAGLVYVRFAAFLLAKNALEHNDVNNDVTRSFTKHNNNNICSVDAPPS